MAGRSANVSVRVEPNIKASAEAILADLGVSASAFINMSYRQGILRQGIPFAVELPAVTKTRDTMIGVEFNKMLQTDLNQVKAGESIPIEQACDSLMQWL